MPLVEFEFGDMQDGRMLELLAPEHAQEIGREFNVMLRLEDGVGRIEGREGGIQRTKIALGRLAGELALGRDLDARVLDSAIIYAKRDRDGFAIEGAGKQAGKRKARKGIINPRTDGQARWLQVLDTFDLSICTGPAGSGKTYLAMAKAVALLDRGEIDRIVVTRPVVEAGERLGFLPGTLQEKVDPFMRPIIDAVADIGGKDRLQKMMQQDQFEVAPLAYMRGRTLTRVFALLDEAQNTTFGQLKMFLTRMGFGTKMAVCGDIEQVDLPKGVPSGLAAALPHLEREPLIGVAKLDVRDVVRHPLVGRVLMALDGVEA